MEGTRCRHIKGLRLLLACCGALALALALLPSCMANPAPPKQLQPNNQAYLEGLGALQGQPCGAYSNVSMYLGVPYALPPQRFAPPVLWNKPYSAPARLANTFPPMCPQRRISKYDQISEDCLYLNIFTPNTVSLGSVAVRVFFHGGWFQEGSATNGAFNENNHYLSDACRSVSDTNTTFVVVQYRLGAIGFLSHPATFAESMSTGNWGIWDQQVALQWISQYIPYFGGNSSVMIEGQNAGGMSVAIHMVAPASWPFFTSAASHNGAAVKLMSQNQAYEVTSELADKLNCSKNPQEQLQCLREQSWETLVKYSPVIKPIYQPWTRVFWPVVDGFIIPQEPLDLISTGQFNAVPYMVVLNKDEGRTFVAQSYPNITLLNQTHVEHFIQNIFWGIDPMQILHHYWIGYPYKNAFEQLSEIWKDIFITCPMLKTITAVSQYRFPPQKPCSKNSPFWQGPQTPCLVPIYMYSYEHVSTCSPQTQLFGASSQEELIFTLNLDNTATSCTLSPGEEQVAYDTAYAFGTLAKVGVPKFGNDSGWAMWDPTSQTAMIGDTPKLSYAMRNLASVCSVFENLVLPPSATPLIPVLTTNPWPIIPGFPLGIRGGGVLPAPPPPANPPPKAASPSTRSSLALLALLVAALLLLL